MEVGIFLRLLRQYLSTVIQVQCEASLPCPVRVSAQYTYFIHLV